MRALGWLFFSTAHLLIVVNMLLQAFYAKLLAVNLLHVVTVSLFEVRNCLLVGMLRATFFFEHSFQLLEATLFKCDLRV